MRIAEAIGGQAQRTLAMLVDAVGLFPAAEWRRGDDPYLVPSRLAYHAVETIDYYFSDKPEDFPWGTRFGAGWEKATPDQLPDQTQILVYVREVEAKLEVWLESLSDELARQATAFPHTGQSQLEFAIYMLRHTQHHVAELNLELHRRRLSSADWR